MTVNTQLIEKLQSLITEGDEVDRCYAIQAIHTIRDNNSTELLIKAMRDEDIDVCVDAITVLGHLGGDSVPEKLIESLINDPDGEIKVACVKALAELGDKKGAEELLKLAEKAPEDASFSNGDWDLWWDMQLASIRGLGKMKLAEAIPVLQRILEEDDCMDIESEIFNSLAEIGGDANEYLFDKLKEGTPRVRRRIAKALGKNQDTSTLKPLARALQDKDADVREATLLALQERGATQYLPAILLTFRDSSSTVRKTAVQVAHKLSQLLQLKESSDSNLLEKLLPLLQDDDPTVKSAALDTLTTLGWKADKNNKELLSSMLRECSGDCFAAVCRAIEAQQLSEGVAVLLYMFRHKELGSEEAIHALTTIGRSKQWNSVIESTLGASIFHEEKMVRVAALEALSELDKSFPQGSDYDGRLPLDMVTEALQGQLKPPLTQKVIPIVPVEDVEKKFEEQQEASADTSDVENDKERDTSFVDNALEQIEQSIVDGEKPHPMSTLDSIAITCVENKLEEQAKVEAKEVAPGDDEELEEFIALTEENRNISNWLRNKHNVDVNVDIQRLAARMLGKANTNNAFSVLLKAFESDDYQLKLEAALSIGVLAEKGLKADKSLNPAIHKALLQELNSEQRDLRIAAARALGEFGEIADIPHLIRKLQDDNTVVRMNVLRSLSNIAMRMDLEKSKEQDAVSYHNLAELMIEQLNNNDTGVHRAVVDALTPLFSNKLNGSAVSLKQAAINGLVNAGLSGSDGQVKEMSMGLNALDKDLSSTHLLTKLDQVSNSIERRYVVEMLGELHRPV